MTSTNDSTGYTRTCEIIGCGRVAVCRMNGICVCERCRQGFVAVGFGAVWFDSSWHGVQGAPYTDEQRAACPGLRALGQPVAEVVS